MTAPVLYDDTFKFFCEFIYEKTGILIQPNKKYLLENRLIKLVEEYNVKGYDELLYLVKYGTNGRDLERLYDTITTNETYFFRETQQFDALIDEIVPEVIKKKGLKGVRVWSAACSTGEEPYTISMMFMEKRPDVFFEIIATDISPAVLSSARRGLYSSYSVRNIPSNYLNKYFKMVGQDFEIDGAVKNPVKFKCANLLDKKFLSEVGVVDVIFCRNVLIYFGERARRDAVSYLYDGLLPGGSLFVGISESLHNVTRAFRPVTMNKIIVYRKGI